MSKLRTYVVTFAVSGTASVEIEARSHAEARRKAKREYEDSPMNQDQVEDPTYGEIDRVFVLEDERRVREDRH